MKPVTSSQLLEFVRTHSDETFFTLAQKKPFIARLVGDGVEYVPQSSQLPRRHGLRWLDRVCNAYSHRNSLKPGDFIDITVHASYTLALIAALLADRDAQKPNFLTDEVPAPDQYWEGALRRITVNAYERDARARSACIEHFGAACQACRFDFGARYGARGLGFIHVHHIRPLSELREGYDVDPERDLIPVCPNCHAMLHQNPSMKVEELRKYLDDGTSVA